MASIIIQKPIKVYIIILLTVVIIVGYKPADNDYYVTPDGTRHNTIIFVCKNDAGMDFQTKFQGTKQVQADMLTRGESYIGSLLCIKFQEYTPDGIPRFPVGKEIRNYLDE